MKPTPFFVAAIFCIGITVLTLWIIATLYNNAMNERAEAILNPPMCITDTQKPIPCPRGEQ